MNDVENTDVAAVLEEAAKQVDRAWCQGVMIVHVNAEVQAACAYGALHNAAHNNTTETGFTAAYIDEQLKAAAALDKAADALAHVFRAECNLHSDNIADDAMGWIFYVNDYVLDADSGAEFVAQCMRKAAVNVLSEA